MNNYTSKPLTRRSIKCHLCGHKWSTISDALMVTCPNCSRKTPKEELTK